MLAIIVSIVLGLMALITSYGAGETHSKNKTQSGKFAVLCLVFFVLSLASARYL